MLLLHILHVLSLVLSEHNIHPFFESDNFSKQFWNNKHSFKELKLIYFYHIFKNHSSNYK